MGSISSWFRLIRKAVGLVGQPINENHPNLALWISDAGSPQREFQNYAPVTLQPEITSTHDLALVPNDRKVDQSPPVWVRM